MLTEPAGAIICSGHFHPVLLQEGALQRPCPVNF